MKTKTKKMVKTVVVVGLARSGKDTAAGMIAEKLGCRKYALSGILAEELRRRKTAATKSNMSELGDELRKRFGMAIVAEKLMERIPGSGSAVISGARSAEEIEHIKRKRPGAVVLEVFAERERRFGRRSGVDPKQRAKFFGRDDADIGNKGLRKVLENADFRISNNSSKGELRRRIGRFIHKI